MIYFTQLIYVKDGQEAVFHQFEDLAIPLISKYNGKLLLRVRPDEKSFVAGSMSNPYEIHLVEFPDERDFIRFGQDEERRKFLHLKEQSIQVSVLYKGVKV